MAFEADGDEELMEGARSAFYAAEGKWTLSLLDRGPRSVEVIQALRTIRKAGLAEVMRFLRSGAPILEGVLVEVEYAESLLHRAGATTARRRIEGDDPELLLAARRVRPVEEQVREYEDLWTKDAHRYELVRVGHPRPGALTIFDRERSAAVLIDEDDHLYDLILLRMQAAGVPVRDATPRG